MYHKNRNLLCGVGVNDAYYTVTSTIKGKRVWCPYYRVWHNMIHRCYNSNYKKANITYIDCCVHEDWHRFSVFKGWMKTQDWRNKVLDKDLISRGNKLYSPENCVFISAKLNSLLIEGHRARGKYLAGVAKNKGSSKYLAAISGGVSKDNNSNHLGTFTTEIEAHNAWRLAKAKQLVDAANSETDTRIQVALRTRALELTPITPTTPRGM